MKSFFHRIGKWLVCLCPLLYNVYCGAQTKKITLLQPDSSYNQVGYTVLNLAPREEWLKEVVELADGSVIGIMQVSTEVNAIEGRICRILPDGYVDRDFNQSRGYFSLYNDSLNDPGGLAIDKHGKIVVLFTMFPGNRLKTYPVITRLNSDGTLDRSYAKGGRLEIKLTKERRLFSMQRAADGSIFMGGLFRHNGVQWNVLAVKLDTNGLLDPSFMGIGKETKADTGMGYVYNESLEENCFKILLDNKGGIFLLGNHDAGGGIPGSEKTYLAIRYLIESNDKDRSFGYREGKSSFEIGPEPNGLADKISNGTLDKNGDMLLLCDRLTTSNRPNRMCIAKMTKQGRLDATFNKTGIWKPNLPDSSFSITKVMVDTANKIWTVGHVNNTNNPNRAFVMRMKPDGTLDSTFNFTGYHFIENIDDPKTTDFMMTDSSLTVYGISSYNSPEAQRTFIAKFKIREKVSERPEMTLAEVNFACSRVGQAIPLTSNSAAPISWSVASGNAKIVGDSLYIMGRGNVELKVRQDELLTFKSIDTTITLQAQCPVKVFEYITPNGDGANDRFHVDNIEFFPESKVTVINKWQEEVFSSSAYKNDWEPKHLQEGTYYYIVHTGENETYKGVLLLEK